MNTEETLMAAEAMKRAAQGELVESRTIRNWKPSNEFTLSINPIWDFYTFKYRIFEFPKPPHGQEWHNPGKLTATQVGVHKGWRLLLVSEIDYMTHNVLEYWLSSYKEWVDGRHGPVSAVSQDTLRTKSPLPPTDPIQKAWDESTDGMEHPGGAYPTYFEDGWKACLKHHKITP